MESLKSHLTKLASGERRFENAFQTVNRMIAEAGVEEVVVNGKTTFDYLLFREGKKHLVGMYDEIGQFASYVRDAAEGGSSKEMAFVLIGEPGNGKTFFVDFLCAKYREFLAKPGNEKMTFKFTGLDEVEGFGNIKEIESQTYEDPAILAMNLMTKEELDEIGVPENIYNNKRPLGACSAFILDRLIDHCGNAADVISKHIAVVPVKLNETSGAVTGKYAARDKITSSSTDLLGEESIQRMLHLTDTANPYRFDLRRGALARVGGGGIHFSDELFKNKTDLVQVYLGVIQNRMIEIDGYRWPLDTLIVCTSNNAEFARFCENGEQAPIIDRCRVCFVSHPTNWKQQEELTGYAIGTGARTTADGTGTIHVDPNLKYAASVAVVLSRLPHTEKLTPIETLKLAAGEVAGDKSMKTLTEVIDELSEDPDVTKRWGQKGIGHRNLGRALQVLFASSGTNVGKCAYAKDFFKSLRRVVLDYVHDAKDRAKFLDDIDTARKMYRERISRALYKAWRDDEDAVKKDVLSYVNMIIGIDSDSLNSDKMWRYRDPSTGKIAAVKIDERFITAVENNLGLKTDERRDSFRTSIRKIYSQKVAMDPTYDFTDNEALVKAVVDVRIKSDIANSGSLVGALANRTNEENRKLYDKVTNVMVEKLGFCPTCAAKTIEYYITPEDE